MKTHLRSLLRLGATCAALAFAATALHAQESAPRSSPGSLRNDVPRISTPSRQWREPLPTRVSSRTRATEDESSQATTARVKFSDPSTPGTLKVSLPWAEVHVTGTDGDEIVVTSTLEQKGKKPVDDDGFRRLDEDVSFEVVEKNNTATIVMSGDNLWAAHGAEFHVQVPRNTNLVLRTEAGGDVQVENIDGDIDINSMNGEVALTDIGSSAVVNTMNGEVTATFKKAPAKPVSITSMNGEIDLRLPVDTKANLRMRTHNGTIRTNFPEGVLQAKSEKTGGKGFSYSPGMSREQTREFARQAERMAREQAKIARDVARAQMDAARAHTEAAREAAEEKEEVETPAPVPAPAAAPVAATPAQPAPAPHAPVPGWGGGKSIVGTLNGGGVDIQLSTMNGTITLRQTK